MFTRSNVLKIVPERLRNFKYMVPFPLFISIIQNSNPVKKSNNTFIFTWIDY